MSTDPSRRPERPKLLYFARRRPGVGRAAFIARWRQHARLGMSMPRWENIERYVHCDALEEPPGGLPCSGCDGVAIVWYRSEERRLAHGADRSAGPLLKADELETFERPVREVAVLTEEHCFLPGAPGAGSGTPKLFLRRRRAAGEAPDAFRRRHLEERGPRLAERLAGLGGGYWQNHARLPAADEAPPHWDLVEEIAGIPPAALVPLLAAGGDLLDATWTRETLLHQRQA